MSDLVTHASYPDLAPPPTLHAFPWPQYYILSFDPGTRDLGVALVAYGAEGSDPMNDEEYYIRYGAVWDVIHNKEGTLQENLEALHGVLQNEPALSAVLKEPSQVDVVIENQEGCDFSNAMLTASLMRMCNMAGALWMYFAVRGHHVEMVGKKSKWGWASLKNAPRYALHNEAKRREMRKKYITYYVMDLMRRQYDRLLALIPAAVKVRGRGDPEYDAMTNMCLVGKQMIENFAGLAMDNKAHICDCITQAMFYGRKRFRKSSKNVFRPDVWARMVEAVTSGGRRGITARVLELDRPAGPKRPCPTGLGLLPAAKRQRRVALTPAPSATKGAPANVSETATREPDEVRSSRPDARHSAEMQSVPAARTTRTGQVKISRYARVPASAIPAGMTIPQY